MDVIGWNLNNRCDSSAFDRTKLNVLNACDPGRNCCRMYGCSCSCMYVYTVWSSRRSVARLIAAAIASRKLRIKPGQVNCSGLHMYWTFMRVYRFRLWFRLEDAPCRSTAAPVRRREGGWRCRHAVVHPGTVPLRRCRRRRRRSFARSSACRPFSVQSQPRVLPRWGRVAASSDVGRWCPQEGSQASHDLLQSAAASAWSSVSEDAVPGTAWARWIGCDARPYTDTGIWQMYQL